MAATNAVQCQYRRGTHAQVEAYVGPVGEIIVDTDQNRLVVQDGATVGGNPQAKLSEVLTNTRTALNDANYSALVTDRFIAYTALTAGRVVTLPAAAAYPTGTELVIYDESGECSSSHTMGAQPQGTDEINGVNSVTTSSTAYGYIRLISNGVSKWTITGKL